MKRAYILGLAICTFAACKPNLKTKTGSSGSVNFSRSIAVGNSVTAGFADNSLYTSGQQNSYPNILATQFKLVGGGSFNQPLMPGNAGYPTPKLVLAMATGCDGVTALGPVSYSGTMDTAGSLNNISSQGPFNNLGAPGVRCVDYLYQQWDLLAASAPNNAPYAYRFWPNPDSNAFSVLTYTVNQVNPTFFTTWLGSDDVLMGYAAKGGQGSATATVYATPQGVFVQAGDISPLSIFEQEYDTVVKELVKNGAKGALINIPDPASLPYFTTIPLNALTLRQGQADTLNAQYLGNTGVHFVAGANNFVVEDHTGNIRQVEEGEFILLTVPQDSLKCAGWGAGTPIPNQYVLTSDEVTNTRNAIASFNQYIQQEAGKYSLAYVDMNTYLQSFISGVIFGGVKYSATFASGGLYSLDGIHFTPRGNAIIANKILLDVNSYYGASVPMADVNSYPGVKFP